MVTLISAASSTELVASVGATFSSMFGGFFPIIALVVAIPLVFYVAGRVAGLFGSKTRGR
jgi:hypothetical protein